MSIFGAGSRCVWWRFSGDGDSASYGFTAGGDGSGLLELTVGCDGFIGGDGFSGLNNRLK